MTENKRARKAEKQPDYLDSGERRALLTAAAASSRDHCLLTLMMYRGLRASEPGLVRLEDFAERTRRLYVRRLKGSISQEYHLTDVEMRAIRRWLRDRGKVPGWLFPGYRGRGMARRQVFRIYLHYAELVQLPERKRHPHSLKHTCATMLLDAGAEIRGVQDHLGHAHISSTLKYAAVTATQRARVHELLERAA
ncbi:MAG: tyrosine-type recombinase/integrase [Bryobacteraceae bacterium]